MEKKINISLLVGIIFVAMNLRAPITAVGPVVSLISEDLVLSSSVAGLVTTIPLVAFAIMSPISPKLARKFSIEKTVFGALIFLIIGLFIRFIPSVLTLFLGTAILGSAIAICNVLIPGLVKKEFSGSSGLVTGIYSVSMNITGALASGISIPVIEKTGISWNIMLGLWGIMALLAFVFWIPQLKRDDHTTQNTHNEASVNVWTSWLAWCITLFMGIQSLIFYVLVAWLPEMLLMKGLSISDSGSMLSLLQLTLLPVTFVIPILAEKRQNQQVFVFSSFMFFMLGLIGLMFGTGILLSLSIMSIGVGGGIAFSLAMLFFSLRTTHAEQASELSGMAQSMGYLLAATGPFLAGVLFDLTASWAPTLLILMGMTVVLLLVGMKAGKNIVIK